MFTALARLLRAALALALALGLGGCFDFDQHLVLRGSGAGRLEVKLRTDPSLKGAFETQTLLPPQAAPIEVTRQIKDGQYIQTEKASFGALSELRLQGESLSLTNNGATLFGAGPKRMTLLRTVHASEEDTSDMGVGLAFQDRIYSFSVTIPGWVEKAHPLIVGHESVKPTIDGATITWVIPMSQALTAGRLDYRVDFFAYMNVTGTVSAAEVKGSPVRTRFAAEPPAAP